MAATRSSTGQSGVARFGSIVATILLLASAATVAARALVPGGPTPVPGPTVAVPTAAISLVEALRRAQVEIALATTAGTALDAALADPDAPELASAVPDLQQRRELATMALARAESKLLTASGLQSTDYALEALDLAASARSARDSLVAELGAARTGRRQEIDRQVAILAPEAHQVLVDTARLSGVELAFQRSEQERLLAELEREQGLVARRRVLEELRRSTRFLRLVADAGPGSAAPTPAAAVPVSAPTAPARPTAAPTTATPVAAASGGDAQWRRRLESAVKAYFEARYEAAATALVGLDTVDGRPGAVIQLFLAAARFQLAASRGGDDGELSAAAAEAARKAASLDPGLVPDPTFFSPRFASFYLAAQ